MWAFLQKSNHSGSVGLPVVDVYGTLKIRASVDDVNSVRKQPAQPKPKQAAGGGKIIVYGRDGCGWCKKIKGDFD